MSDAPDLLAALANSIEMARAQRARDNQPCPDCGGDRLWPDFTGAEECHAVRIEREAGESGESDADA